MKKFLPVIGILAVLIMVAILINNKRNSSDSTHSQILGITSTPSITSTSTSTITPTATPKPTTTPTPESTFSCSSISSEIKKLAKTFMDAHKNRDVSVLNQLTPAESDEEAQQYAFLMGYDADMTPRLYSTAQTAYTTKSYSLGNINSAGQDPTNRGNDLCTIQIFEVRQSKVQESFSEETLTRYIDITVTPDRVGKVNAFKDGKNGTKYSGFN